MVALLYEVMVAQDGNIRVFAGYDFFSAHVVEPLQVALLHDVVAAQDGNIRVFAGYDFFFVRVIEPY